MTYLVAAYLGCNVLQTLQQSQPKAFSLFSFDDRYVFYVSLYAEFVKTVKCQLSDPNGVPAERPSMVCKT